VNSSADGLSVRFFNVTMLAAILRLRRLLKLRQRRLHELHMQLTRGARHRRWPTGEVRLGFRAD